MAIYHMKRTFSWVYLDFRLIEFCRQAQISVLNRNPRVCHQPKSMRFNLSMSHTHTQFHPPAKSKHKPKPNASSPIICSLQRTCRVDSPHTNQFGWLIQFNYTTWWRVCCTFTAYTKTNAHWKAWHTWLGIGCRATHKHTHVVFRENDIYMRWTSLVQLDHIVYAILSHIGLHTDIRMHFVVHYGGCQWMHDTCYSHNPKWHILACDLLENHPNHPPPIFVDFKNTSHYLCIRFYHKIDTKIGWVHTMNKGSIRLALAAEQIHASFGKYENRKNRICISFITIL